MNDRYHLDRRTHRYRRARRRAVVAAVIIFFGALFYFLANLRIEPTQNIVNDQSVVKPYAASSPKKVMVDKPLFTLELPEGWQESKPDSSMVPAPQYVFISQPKDQQILRLYVDTVPAAMGINKAVTVSARGRVLTTSQSPKTVLISPSSAKRTAAPDLLLPNGKISISSVMSATRNGLLSGRFRLTA